MTSRLIRLTLRSLLLSSSILLLAAPLAIAQDQAQSKFESGVVYLEADEIFEDKSQNRFVARGEVEARYENRILRADEVIYFPDQDTVHAKGSVIVIEPDGNVEFADEVELKDDLATGVALGFFARLDNNATIGAAHATHAKEGRRNTLSKAFYTACEACQRPDGSNEKPTWRLRAREAVQDHESQMITYRDAVFELKGVPVLYSPYFAHADPTAGRKSGLMFPSAGYSGKYGLFYEQPYYKVLSPYSDATISLRAFTGKRPMVRGEYRRKFYSGDLRLRGAFTHENEFDADGNSLGNDVARGYAFGDGRFRVSPNWQWGFSGEYVSDDLFFKRYNLPIGGNRGLFGNSSQRLSNQLYAVGQKEDFYASIAAVRYQGLRSSDVDNSFPVALPLINAQKVLARNIVGGNLSGSINTAVLNRVDGIDSRRATVTLDWKAKLTTKNGIIAKPFAQVRGDYYNVVNQDYITDLGTDNQSFARALGVVGAEVRWPWLRAGKNVNWVVEPIIHLSASPEGDGVNDFDLMGTSTSLIPNEDSLLVDFDESFLFRPSRFAGYDQWEDGLRASVGGRISARWGDQNYASLVAGRVFSSVQNEGFGNSSSLQEKSSDYVAGATYSTGRSWNVSTHLRLDKNSLEPKRFDAIVGTRLNKKQLGGLSGFLYAFNSNIGYANVTSAATGGSPLHEISARAEPYFTKNWGGIFSIVSDFEKSDITRMSAGIVYDDDCSRFEIVYQNDKTSSGGLAGGESIKFRFTLDTLGTFGGG